MMRENIGNFVPREASPGSPQLHNGRVAIVPLLLTGLRNRVPGTKIPIDSPVRVCYLERSRTLAKGCGSRWHDIRKSDRHGKGA
jgi:hypothetical protein